MFAKKAHFPNCFGSVDGKHVRVIKPQHSGSLCLNYKEYFSVVLMVVGDSEYKFVYVDIGSHGKDSDPTVFSNSTFWKAVINGELKLPEPNQVPNDEGAAVPYVTKLFLCIVTLCALSEAKCLVSKSVSSTIV